MRLPLRRLVALLAIVSLSATSWAWACNVPVFRYALERWRPDRYRLTLFHKGKLDAAAEGLLTSLNDRIDQHLVNVDLIRVNVDELEGKTDKGSVAMQELLAAQKEAELPWLVLQYPAALRIPTPLAGGPLSDDFLKKLTGSTARSELVRRLMAGESVVWVLLESGDAEKDKVADETLRRELPIVRREMKLPKLEDSADDRLLAKVDLKLEFSVLNVKRRDPAEASLVAMLLHSEPDLLETDEPMVFPVFGRGRGLYSLVGKGITPENIRDTAEFVCGACSCEVKELSPGFDIVMSADWDSLLTIPEGDLIAARAPKPAGVSTPELVPIPKGSPPSEATKSDRVAPELSKPNASATPLANVASYSLIAVLLLAAAYLMLGSYRG